MLRELHIENIILVEKATIAFERGYNVLTGETGSGKSAVIGALRLIIGERADPAWLRRGAKRGVVEALFDVPDSSPLNAILDEAGIASDEAGLLIRRELGSRSRAFVNNQSATLHLLKQIQPYLVHLVDQHANHALLSRDSHRALLDLYGDCLPLLHAFREALEAERSAEKTLGELKAQEAARLREQEVCRMEVTELEEANLREGEDEELFEEFSRLTNAGTLSGLSKQLLSIVQEGCLSQLHQARGPLARFVELDPAQEELHKTVEGLAVELEEVAYSLRAYHSGINHNPERQAMLDERLGLIAKLKRKYGESISEIEEYLEGRLQRLEELDRADDQIEQLEAQLVELCQETELAAAALTEARTAAAATLQQELTKELRPLNMAKAEVRVEVTQVARSQQGDDQVTFLMAPNVGERFVALGEGISGGELARLMLAIRTVLASKEQVATLIFDELDANIGGETAAVVGEKLGMIGEERQLLCITHFAQVAAAAGHHLYISKREEGGRTLTSVQALSADERKLELARMVGGVEFHDAAKTFGASLLA